MAAVGRPPKYKSAGEMQEKIDAYFEDCKGEPLMVDGEPYLDKYGQPVIIHAHPPTVTGLALALGFTSRQALLNYQGKQEFVDTVMRAKLRIESYTEERLYDRDGQRGAEFSLKYNFRWVQDENEDAKQTSGVVILPAVAGMPGEGKDG